MKKIVVATREEALKLIADGTNSMLVFSPEAPYGYKKDGTVAGRRGRPALTDEAKAAREASAVAQGKTRTKTGPIVKTPEAPFGMKKDGTPMLKRGRPTAEASVARRAAATAARLQREAERAAKKAEKKAARDAEKAAKAASAVTLPATTEALVPVVVAEEATSEVLAPAVAPEQATEPSEPVALAVVEVLTEASNEAPVASDESVETLFENVAVAN